MILSVMRGALAALLVAAVALAQPAFSTNDTGKPDKTAEDATTTPPTQPPSRTLNEGWEVNTGAGGTQKIIANTSYCKFTYEGPITVDSTNKKITVSAILTCDVPTGSANNADITCHNINQINVDNNGTTVTVNGDGNVNNGVPDININANNTTVNANDRGCDIDIGSGRSGTTVNTGNSSSGTVNQSGGFNGAFNTGSGAGYGPWSVGS